MCLRRPKTANEKRQWGKYIFDQTEYGVIVHSRIRRSANILVDSYSDIIRTDAGLRNWKHFRRTQYKIS